MSSDIKLMIHIIKIYFCTLIQQLNHIKRVYKYRTLRQIFLKPSTGGFERKLRQ